jgi:hypothetical protein
MQLPPILQGNSIFRLLLGAFVGFAATGIIGFTWGGWTLGKTAKQMAEQRAATAVVAALAPICVDKFRRSAEAATNLIELKKVNVWEQGTFITRGGWATIPGGTVANPAVAEACAVMLSGTWWR